MTQDTTTAQSLTRKAAADHLDYTLERLDRLTASGEIPCISQAGSEQRYLVATLDRLRSHLDQIPDDHIDLSRFSKVHEPLLTFIRCGRHLHIGITRNVSTLYRDFTTANPLPVAVFMVGKGDQKLEKKIHADFKELHVKGGWFRNQEPLTAFVQDLYAGFTQSWNRE